MESADGDFDGQLALGGGMKVGILTFHNTSNYGAALQALATVEAINALGVNAEIIDYVSKARGGRYGAFNRVMSHIKSRSVSAAIKSACLSPGVYIRNRSFQAFYDRYLSVSQVRYSGWSELSKTTSLYDCFVAGSDQIWSYKNNGGDLAYLLDFVPADTKTLSYASSFGVGAIPAVFRKNYETSLRKINKISVREKEGAKLVTSLTGRDAEVVVDPVLLLSQEYWESIASPCVMEKGSFDLLYVNNLRAREFEWNFGDSVPQLPVVSLGTFKINDLWRKNVYVKAGEGPRQFLSYIRNARLVYTTSYHAVLFCLIFNVPFYVFLSGDEGRDSRIQNVLEEYGLSARAVTTMKQDIIPKEEVDFSYFNAAWSQKKEQSYSFIKRALFEGGRD